MLCLSWRSNAQQAPIAPPPPTPQESQPPPPQDKDKGKAPSDHKEGAGAAVDSNTYKIGPSDVLSIRVWNEEKFSGPVAVHQDGKITLPLLGDIQAGDLTPVQVQENVTKALTKYVVKPLVTVVVMEVGSKKYYLDGQVNHPGEFPLAVPTTILEAISKAGGLQEFANSKKIYVLRGDKRIPFNYKDVLRGKHMEQNIRLEPGDHIVVP
jgi:polysaccharide biosynthesis/export protein